MLTRDELKQGPYIGEQLADNGTYTFFAHLPSSYMIPRNYEQEYKTVLSTFRLTTSSPSSTTTEPAPVITSINPSSGPIGTIVELKGNNLAGFEGELSAWIENSNGEKAFLPGSGSVPRADQTIRVKIDSRLCKFDYGMKGEPVGGCTSYLTITPGTYKIYTYPWGNMSNTVQFTVTN